MISDCERCQLPEILRRIDAYRNATDIANANIRVSSSPAEAEPFKQTANKAVSELRKAYLEHAEFLNMWGGFCIGCKFGA